MRTHTRLSIATLVAGLLAVGTTSQACDGGFGYGWGIGQLYSSMQYNVPHFAAFPPVYYSYPVPRTYGHSPFAYPPHFRTPEFAPEAVEAVTITNPYVTPASDQAPKEPTERTVSHPAEASEAAQPQPLVIENPYVTGSDRVVHASR